jgi:hypothetical protein
MDLFANELEATECTQKTANTEIPKRTGLTGGWELELNTRYV